MSAVEKFTVNKKLKIFWFANILAIFSLSCFGRPMQRTLTHLIGRAGVGWIMLVLTASAVSAAAIALIRRKGKKGLYHILWITLLVAFLMWAVRRHPEVWLHIPLFGTLGFLSYKIFLRTGAEAAFAMAFADELLQHFLPDRVGDFMDVLINAVCAAVGIIFFLILNRR